MSGSDDPVVGNLEAGQSRIESALNELTRTVNRKFEEMGQKFVPREELSVTFDNIKDHQRAQDERITQLEAGRMVDRQSVETRMQNAKVVAMSMAGGIVTALGLIIAHWK